MFVDLTFGLLAVLSFALGVWQWYAARRFPLHQRATVPPTLPDITLLKPLKGCETGTFEALRSWFLQLYPGRMQIIFGVADADDPVCAVVRQLQTEFPQVDASLLICDSTLGTNAKVSKLIQMERQAQHQLICISDADVRVPPDFLAQTVPLLHQKSTGLANAFYSLETSNSLAMQWEAVGVNADFWSQVLQSATLKPVDFALGAVMITRRANLQEIGGFTALKDCLADDYQLGNRIVHKGYSIALGKVVVECLSGPLGWPAVWKHQLRWARTIRVCQPAPYFLSILSNGTLWPMLWAALSFGKLAPTAAALFVLLRVVMAVDLQRRIGKPLPFILSWMIPVKDLLQTGIWAAAFLGNHIEWRGETMRLRPDGTLVKR